MKVRFRRAWQRFKVGDELEPLGSLRDWLFENGYVEEVQMKVQFTHEIRNAGTVIYEKGQIATGDLEIYVRRGQAVEVKDAAPPAPAPARKRGRE